MATADNGSRARLTMRIRGRVQGVMFRVSAADEARAMGITGCARNMNDGSVEIVADGRVENLRMLAVWAHLGPPGARVSEVDEIWSDYQDEFATFMVR